ncbi:hypothetical protein SAMN05720268_2776 [Polaribacter sp. KT 15]|nr:hypothetical protein SAMN05720268_2776 [Polaribacter sp. KT 15]
MEISYFSYTRPLIPKKLKNNMKQIFIGKLAFTRKAILIIV